MIKFLQAIVNTIWHAINGRPQQSQPAFATVTLNPTANNETKNLLAVVLRHDHDYLFFEMNQDNLESFTPILLTTDTVAENHLASVRDILRRQHGTIDAEIHMVPHTLGLRPMAMINVHLAVVTIDDEEFIRLSGQFTPVSASRILLNRERNVFFDLIARGHENNSGVLQSAA